MLKKYIVSILLICLVILLNSCVVGSKHKKIVNYEGENKNTFIDLKTQTIHFGISINSNYEVWLRCDSLAMNVRLKPITSVTMYQIPDIIFNYSKNKKAVFNVYQSFPFKELFRFKFNESDWLDSNGKKAGMIAPYRK
jgi:hypothetical protein